MNKYYFLLIYVFCIVSFQACNERNLKEEVDVKVIEPYLKLIRDGKYNEAYQIYTSKKYKKYNTLEAYENSHHRLIRKYGPLIGFENRAINLFKPLYTISGNLKEIQYEIGLKYEKNQNSVCVVYILSPESDSTYLIDSGWHNANKCIKADDGSEDGPY
jgi:hypothetical protein